MLLFKNLNLCVNSFLKLFSFKQEHLGDTVRSLVLNNFSHDSLEIIKKAFHGEMSIVETDVDRNRKLTLSHNIGEPLLLIRSVIDESDILQLDILSKCIKANYPRQHESRLFNESPNQYAGDELLLDAVEDEHQFGGNEVTFMEGFIQYVMPKFVSHVMTSMSDAVVKVGWYPHPRQLGVRCVESLLYHSGGVLQLHTDSESIFTLVIMLSDESTDFSGGDFVIQQRSDIATTLLRAAPKRGDAILFDSNALHGVESILTGKRRVLVIEMWPYQDVRQGDRRPGSGKYGLKVPTFLMTRPS